MSDVSLSSGLPETVLPDEPAEARAALADALSLAPAQQAAAVRAVVARWPSYLDAWAQLGRRARDDVEAYACFRVGYHRGLDRLRQAGWRGSGYVRWARESNRGFLRALHGLGQAAARLGEHEEAERCDLFVRQLDGEAPAALAQELSPGGGAAGGPAAPPPARS